MPDGRRSRARPLPADVRARLEARGIDPANPERAWVQAIRDGSFPISAMAHRPAGKWAGVSGPQREHRSPGARLVPVPIPLAVVLPSEPRR